MPDSPVSFRIVIRIQFSFVKRSEAGGAQVVVLACAKDTDNKRNRGVEAFTFPLLAFRAPLEPSWARRFAEILSYGHRRVGESTLLWSGLPS